MSPRSRCLPRTCSGCRDATWRARPGGGAGQLRLCRLPGGARGARSGGLQRAAVTAALLIPLMNLVAISVLELYRKRTSGRSPDAACRRQPAGDLCAARPALSAAGWRPWAGSRRRCACLPTSRCRPRCSRSAPSSRSGVARRLAADATATGLKLVVLPLLGWWALVGLGASAAEIGVGVLLLATPTAIASYPVAAELAATSISRRLRAGHDGRRVRGVRALGPRARALGGGRGTQLEPAAGSGRHAPLRAGAAAPPALP